MSAPGSERPGSPRGPGRSSGPGGIERRVALATEETYLRAIDGVFKDPRPTRALITFVVGGESYGIEILAMREIIKMREITEVPRVPNYVLGVISVRGQVIPVLDLRLRLGLEPTPSTRAARILVVAKDNEPFGLVVDAVTGVVRAVDAEIEPPPSTLSVANASLISGIARLQSGRRTRLIVLLTLGAVLDIELDAPKKAKELS